MLNRKISILFIVLLLGMLCVAIPAWANGTAIGPQAPAAVNVGDQFTVDIVLNNATAVMAVQFNMQFDPSLLQADQVTDGNIFTSPLPLQNVIDNTTGNIKYASMVLVPVNAYTGTGGTAAVITFTALAAGSANLSFVLADTILGGEGGTNIEHTTTEVTVTINGQVVQKPVITPLQPLDGATNVALDAPVQATSNMDVTNVNLAGVTINPESGASATLGGDSRTITIAHNDFAYSTTYTVTIPAGAVMNGGQTNDLTTWSFTTLAAPPPEKPVLTLLQPLNGATNVALGATVQATSNMDVTNVNLAGVTINPESGASATLGGDNRTITIAHNAFNYSTTYTVTIPAGAVMNGGQTNDLTTWSFTTLAAPPPEKPVLTPLQPLNGATNVALDAPVQATSNMDVTNVNLAGVTINPESGASATLGGDNRTITIAHNDFAYDTTYTVTIPAGAVMNGDGQQNDLATWTFTTATEPQPQQLNVTVNLTGDNISPDRPLTIEGSAGRGGTPEDVGWSVVIKNSGGIIVATYTPENGSSFNQLYTPVMDLPIVADYTVRVTATPGVGDPVTKAETFHVYNFPLKFSVPQITGSGSTRTVTATLDNLTQQGVNGAVVCCQVTKTRTDGVTEVKSAVYFEQKNIAGSGAENISFNIDAPGEPGTYQVNLFVISTNEDMRHMSTLAEQVIADLVI